MSLVSPCAVLCGLLQLPLAVLALPASARAVALISEVLYDGEGSDDGQVFVELYGAAGTLLDGIELEGVNGFNGAVGPTLTLVGVIPEDGVFVIADDAGDGTTRVENADLILDFDFQNGYQKPAKSRG